MTAYLKAHYPVEFMAALLSGDIPGRNFKKKDSLVEHLEDCQRMDIAVRAARREPLATPISPWPTGKILLRPVGHQGLRRRRRPRRSSPSAQAGGPFRSLFDFCERLDPARCNRAAIETLVKAGAFDSLGARRAQLIAALDRAMQAGRRRRRRPPQRPEGPVRRRRRADDAGRARRSLPDVPAWDERERLAKEKEVLGFYLVQPSAGRAREDAGRLLLAHDRRSGRAEAPHRSDARRHALGDQVLAHEEPQAGQPQPLRHVRPGRHRRASSAASSGPSSSPSTASWSSPTRSWSSAARSTSGPAARRRT